MKKPDCYKPENSGYCEYFVTFDDDEPVEKCKKCIYCEFCDVEE